MNTKKLFYYLSMLTIFLGTLLILLVTYWLVAPYTVLTFGKENNILLTKTVKSGGYLQIRRDFCKKVPLTAKISRQFIDSLKYDAHLITSDEPVRCKKDVLYIYIPKALPAGEYYVQDTYTYKVNPVRTIEYTLKSEIFTILPKE